jgi:basic amino acid/polyamine antiporter, APA family
MNASDALDPPAVRTAPKHAQLGFWMCTALVVGNTIGIGIFMQPALLAPYGLNAFIAWAITVFGCVVLALVFALLARTLSRADGPFEYMRSTLGEFTAFLAIWCYWVSCWVTNAALATGVIGYMKAALPMFGDVSPAGLAVGLIWFFVAVNLLGARTGGGVQVLTTILKLTPMAMVIGAGLWLLIGEPSAYVAQVPTTPITWSGTIAASTIALFAMLGIESATIPATKVRDPERTIPRATVVGAILTALVYVAVTAIALLLIPQEQLASSSAPFVDVLNRLVGGGGGRWLAFFILMSGLGALNGWTLLVAELTRTLAKNGLLPAPLANVNARGAPVVALVLTAAFATIVTLMNYSKSLVDGFTFLSTLVTAANLPLYICCGLALVVLWRRGTGHLGRAALWLGIVGAAYSVFATVGVGFAYGTEVVGWALVLAAAGLPFYALRFLRLRSRAALPPEGGPAQ